MSGTVKRDVVLQRIEGALRAAALCLSAFTCDEMKVEYKLGDDPVTEADRRANAVLQEALIRDREGWLSEESIDDMDRTNKERVWIVDPLDGTREFIAGTPEWCISVALAERGKILAGGVFNPAKNEMFLGAPGEGITLNGRTVQTSKCCKLSTAVILASRREFARGDWDRFIGGPFEIRPVGSIAYKLALVAAGVAEATWTLGPKNEWDVAAGVALVEAGGGLVRTKGGDPPIFNRECTLFRSLLACGPFLHRELAKNVWLSEFRL